MSSSLSPRQAESVEHWLDDQPRSHNGNGRSLISGQRPPTQEKDTKTQQPLPSAYNSNKTHNANNYHYHHHHHSSRLPPLDRDLHVQSRLQMHSRLSRASYFDVHDAYVDPIECFLRVCSACLASAALAAGAVTYGLVHHHSSRIPLDDASALDNRLGWVVAVPVSAAAIVWQLTRLSLLAWHTLSSSSSSAANSALLLGVDILLEAVLAVGSVICSILAGFQAARHMAYNRQHASSGSDVEPMYEHKYGYDDVGPEIALCALLGLMSLVSFAIMALAFVEVNRRRRSGASSRSTSSSVIEIIS
ncbi:MAG: hypothetical protein STHCBS139747_002253 [Sporothrix thermara]